MKCFKKQNHLRRLWVTLEAELEMYKLHYFHNPKRVLWLRRAEATQKAILKIEQL